jgi:hypothetical protein
MLRHFTPGERNGMVYIYRQDVPPNRWRSVMHTVSIHLDERLNSKKLHELCEELRRLPHVKHVAVSPRTPQDMLVDYEEHHSVPMAVLRSIEQRGLHPDIVSC